MDQLPNKQPKASKIEKHEEITVEYAFDTIKSPLHQNNEDSIIVDRDEKLFAVFDGMGGRAEGNLASRTACSYILSKISKIKNGINTEAAKRALREIVIGADKEVNKMADTNAEYKGMGTTASVLKIHTDEEGKNCALISNIGDSRVYKINKDGKIEQLTTDDDRLSESKWSKKDKLKISKNMSEARKYEDLIYPANFYFDVRHMIRKWIGEGNNSPSVFSVPIEKGGRFIITSDGIHDNLTTQEIEEIIRQSSNIQDVISNLMEESINRSQKLIKEEMRAKTDDMSAILIAIN